MSSDPYAELFTTIPPQGFWDAPELIRGDDEWFIEIGLFL